MTRCRRQELPQGKAVLHGVLQRAQHAHLQLCMALRDVLLARAPAAALLDGRQHADLEPPQLRRAPQAPDQEAQRCRRSRQIQGMPGGHCTAKDTL